MKNILCLQHVAFEGPGYFQKVFEDLGCRLDRRLVPEIGVPREWPDALLVMGGPMSVNDPDGWILRESEFIREAVARGVPYLGVCLGSQFLAKAIGGQVGPGPAFELGMTGIQLTDAAAHDPLFRRLPPQLEVFQWHGEGITLPPGAVPLARSTHYPVQAFRHGRAAYGLLFHVEIEAAGVDALCQHGEAELARARRDAAEVEEETSPHLTALNRVARQLGRAFVDLL
jgi:GMP synthase (glutamine-hydrolysing)